MNTNFKDQNPPMISKRQSAKANINMSEKTDNIMSIKVAIEI